MRNMANSLPGAYIFAVFDCCRKEIPKGMRDSPRATVSELKAVAIEAEGEKRGYDTAGRGIISDTFASQASTAHAEGNIVIVYGCEPDKGTSAWSSVASNVFEQFRAKADPATGTILLPDVMQHFKVGDNGEVIEKTSRKLCLRHKDWKLEHSALKRKLSSMQNEMQGMLSVMHKVKDESVWTVEMDQMLSMMKGSTLEAPSLSKKQSIVANKDPLYFGASQDGKRHGLGIKFYANGGRYEGMWEHGMKSGQGTFRFANGGIFTGNWKQDKADGRGVLTLPSGSQYIGQFADDKKHGDGTWTSVEGTVYQGQWQND